MAEMQDYDFSNASDRQAFQRYIIELIRNEINSYAKQSNNKNSNYIKPDTLSDIDRIRQLESIVLKGG
jgi:hypothetical protein